MDPIEEFFKDLKQNSKLIKIGLIVLVLVVPSFGVFPF